MAIAPGTCLGPYEIVSHIGAGGMGEVWKARDTRLDRTVAIKVASEKFSERFEREARAVAALNHPHICTLHDVGPNYLVMEYIDGRPLKGPMPVGEALRLAPPHPSRRRSAPSARVSDRAYIAGSCSDRSPSKLRAGGGACHRQGGVSAAGSRLRVLFAATLFSTGGAAFKLSGFTGWQVAGLRGAVAAIAVLAMVPQARRAWTWRAALVGGAYAVTTILFVQANKLTTAASAVFLEDASPLCILVLGPWLLREPVQRGDVAFLLAAAVGMTLFFVGVEPPRATATNPLLGNVLAAVSALPFALVVIGYRWPTQRPGGPAAPGAAAAVSRNIAPFVFSLPWIFPGAG